MDDMEMYQSGWMNPAEQEWWDYVTQMMDEAGPTNDGCLDDYDPNEDEIPY
jgi:hypothetical protein